jgi:hypothetical protein
LLVFFAAAPFRLFRGSLPAHTGEQRAVGEEQPTAAEIELCLNTAKALTQKNSIHPLALTTV